MKTQLTLKENNYQLEISRHDDNTLNVRLSENGTQLGAKTFRDSETQHHDSERWLNGLLGYPNPFAGILANPTVW
jgi:hypothetical protein